MKEGWLLGLGLILLLLGIIVGVEIGINECSKIAVKIIERLGLEKEILEKLQTYLRGKI